MRITNIDAMEVGKKAKVVSVIWGCKAAELAVESKKHGADILEARIDLYKPKDNSFEFINNTLEKGYKETGCPFIITIRKFEQGGLYIGDEDLREKLFYSFIDAEYTSLVDIELRSIKIRDKVINYAKSKNKKVIVSYHEDCATPSLSKLEAIADQAYEIGADIVKIATQAGNKEDVARLLGFTLNYEKLPLVTISTGLIGKVSRLMFPFFGSCLSYGYINKKVDPGQIHVSILRYFLNNLDPSIITEKLSKGTNYYNIDSLNRMIEMLSA